MQEKNVAERPLKDENTVRDTSENGLKLFNFRPALFCAVFLCFGILFGYGRVALNASFWWLLSLLPITALLFFFSLSGRRWKKRVTVYSLVLALFFSLGALTSASQIRSFTQAETYEGERSVLGLVVDKETDGRSYCVVLSDINVDGTQTERRAKVYVEKRDFERISLADELLAVGEMRTDTDLYNDYGFRANAIEDNSPYYVLSSSVAVTGEEFAPFLRIRNRLYDSIYQGMDETPAAVTIATLTGNTSWINETLLENIRYGGIAHIFAVSGLHIGALYAFCLLLTTKTRLSKTSKPLRFLFTATLMLLYGGVCGFSSSVIRAIVMCLCFYAVKLIGGKTDGLETLGLAACIVLLLSPVSLLCVGFQLSFAACIGIIVFSRSIRLTIEKGCAWIKAVCTRKKVEQEEGKAVDLRGKENSPLTVAQRIKRSVISFFGVTVSAQICTAPIQLTAFGYLPGWSLLFNFLFVPLISAVFSVLLLFALLACILPTAWLSVWLYVPNMVWSVLLLLFETVDLSTFALSAWNISTASVICYYLTLLLCSEKCNLRKMEKWIIFLIGTATFIVSVCI